MRSRKKQHKKRARITPKKIVFIDQLGEIIIFVSKVARNVFYSILTYTRKVAPIFLNNAIKGVLKIKDLVSLNIQTFLGSIYSRYTNFRENDRLRTYRIEKEVQDHTVIRDILRYSKQIIIYLVLIATLSFLLDWLFWSVFPYVRSSNWLIETFTLPSRSQIEVGLEIFVGAISAILGLIFAMYTVGVQLASDRYSEKVSSFIIQEPVTDYFFKFLIFTDLYSIIILLRLHLVSSLPLVSFFLASILVALSIMGILVFKSHYINSLKPLSLFQRLWRTCLDQFQLVTNPRNYKYKSWSLAIHGRDITNSNLNIYADLFRDLARNKNWNDASFGPVILGYILRDYLEVKKFVDKEKGWWFFEKYEQVKADDLNMFTIKANYELQGKGPLHIPKAAENWLEDKVIGFLEEMVLYIHEDKSGKLAGKIADGYKQFLVGNYEERRGQRPKLIPGAIQNQEFGTFDKGVVSFLQLWQKIDFTKADAATVFLNDYFAISEELLEPWEIEKTLSIAKLFYEGDQLDCSKHFLYQKDLPAYTRDILLNYWERLEVEQRLEGKLITPQERFVDEIKEVLNDKRKEIVTGYLTKFFDNSDLILKSLYQLKNYEYVGQFIKMQYEWVSRLLYLGDVEIAQTFAQRIKKNAAYIAYLPRQTVIDLELLEQIEKGFFVSLSERSKSLFEVYAPVAVLILIIIRTDENDQDKLFRLMKLPVIWGGITYLVSELEIDFDYVTCLSKALEGSFREGWMVQILEQVAELRPIRNIWWETTRYHSWYMNLLNKLRRELRIRPYQEPGALGFSERYDHPSLFIQELAAWELMDEEKCMEGFIDWLKLREENKKREEIKKLITVLKKIGEKNEQKT
jgi:hypothetical protein